MSVSRGTSRTALAGPMVRPLLFRKVMREAIEHDLKTVTRRIVAADNAIVSPGSFAGVDLNTGRARRPGKPPMRASIRARCTFESGLVRVVSVVPVVDVGDLFWVKTGRFGRRADSRLTLEVTSVDVSRVQDMSDADALAEGVARVVLPPRASARFTTPRDKFGWLWEQINGRGSWARNPWVWVYGFRTFHDNVDSILERWEARTT